LTKTNLCDIIIIMDINHNIVKFDTRTVVFLTAAVVLLSIFAFFNDCSAQAADNSPILSVSVSANKTTVSPEEEIIYTITYRNTGNAAATGIVIKIPLIDTNQNYLEFVSASPIPDSGNNTWIIDEPLGYNESEQITITVRTKSAFSSSRIVLRDRASIDSNEITPKYSNYVSVSINSSCRLSVNQLVRNVSKNSLFGQSVNADSGDEVEFSLEIKSIGTNQAVNTKIWDNLSSHLEYIFGSAMIDGSSLGAEVVGNKVAVGDLLSGATKTVRFRVRVGSSSNFYVGKNYLRSNGYADADICAVKSSTATVVVIKKSASLAVVTSSGLTISKLARNVTKKSNSWTNTVYTNPGDEIEFLIKIKSTNKETISVRVQDTLPPKMFYISDSTTVDGNYESDGVITKNVYLANVYPSLTREIRFKVKVAPESEFNLYPISLVNEASAWGNDGKEIKDSAKLIINKPTQSSVKGVSIVSGRSLSLVGAGRNIAKNQSNFADSFSANPGDEVEFSIKVSNIGDTGVNNVKVRDNLPAKFSVIEGSTNIDGASWGGDVTGSGLNLGTLGKGTIKTIKFRARVNSSGEFSSASTNLINSVFVTGDDVSQLSGQVSVIVQKAGEVLGAATVKTGFGYSRFLFILIISAILAVIIYCRIREEKLLEILNDGGKNGFLKSMIRFYFRIRLFFKIRILKFKRA
jgi:uncharacterized repeat protein (TIGR01451 family)